MSPRCLCLPSPLFAGDGATTSSLHGDGASTSSLRGILAGIPGSVQTPCAPDLVKHLSTRLRDLLNWDLLNLDAMLSADSLPMPPGSLTVVWLCECFRILLLSKAGPLSSMMPRGEAGTLVLPQQVGLSSVTLWWEMNLLSLHSSQQVGACCSVWVHTPHPVLLTAL